MKEALAPCLWCGGKTKATSLPPWHEGIREYAVYCASADCNAHGPWLNTKKAAIAAWNRVASKESGHE